jgi:hypothetical protein
VEIIPDFRRRALDVSLVVAHRSNLSRQYLVRVSIPGFDPERTSKPIRRLKVCVLFKFDFRNDLVHCVVDKLISQVCEFIRFHIIKG